MAAMTRKSVPVDPAEYETVQRLRTPGSPEREALRAAGVELSDTPSEAEALHALLVVGRRALDEQLLEIGYAALAAAEDEEDHAARQAMRARRTGSLIDVADRVPVRGRVYMADIGSGRKPWLVVSNNARNRQLDSCLAVRITTTPKPLLESIIELGPDDPVVGRVLCDDIAVLYRHELSEDRGALAPSAMAAVASGLRVALALH